MNTQDKLIKRFRNGRIVCEQHARNIEVRLRIKAEMQKLFEQQLIMKRLSK